MHPQYILNIILNLFGTNICWYQLITAFRKTLKEFEKKDEEEVEKKMKDLIDVDIDLQLQPNSKDDEDPIVSKIIKL